MKIDSDEFNVLANGVVMSHGMRVITFTLSEQPRMAVAIRVLKVDGEEPEISAEIESADTLVLTFKNPNTLNFGSAEPIEVGAINGRKLTAALRVNVFGDYSSYEVMYTFYLGEKTE